MSVVVAARTRRHGVVMACDSQVTDGYIKESVTTTKIWTDGVVLFGACGDLRTVQVIKNHTPKASPDSPGLQESLLVNTLVKVLQEQAHKNGTLTKSDEGVWGFDAHLLIASGDDVAMIDNTFAVMIPDSGRAAIGTGREVALGALGVWPRWSRLDVLNAARVATKLSVNVAAPVYLADTERLVVESESQAFPTGGN